MVYMGSKNRIAKYILPFLTKYLTPDRWYVEPFAGGMNMMDKVKHNKRLANDINEYLIELWKHLQDGGTLPQFIEREEYYKVKEHKSDYPKWYVGHVGFNCSRLGIFFNSYVGEQNGRNFQHEHINSMNRQILCLNDVLFKNFSYSELPIPDDSVIYCDPPYCNTRKYKDSIDHDIFFEWCREKSKRNDVLISEYDAPKDFTCIWELQVKSGIIANGVFASTEKLFVHESIAFKYIEKQQTLF